MGMTSAGRVLHGALLVGLAGGTAVAVIQANSMRQELTELRQRLSQVERRPATSSQPVTTERTVALPSGDVVPSSGTSSAEVAELRRRLDELSAKVDPAAAADPADVASLPEALSIPADGTNAALAALPQGTRDALKAVVNEAIEEREKERDKVRSEEMATRGVERVLDRLAQELALSESQKQMLKGVLDERAKKFTELWQSDLPREERGAKMTELRKETDTAIKRSLTSEQALKYDQLASQDGGMGLFFGGRGYRGPGGGSTGGSTGQPRSGR